MNNLIIKLKYVDNGQVFLWLLHLARNKNFIERGRLKQKIEHIVAHITS